MANEQIDVFYGLEIVVGQVVERPVGDVRWNRGRRVRRRGGNATGTFRGALLAHEQFAGVYQVWNEFDLQIGLHAKKMLIVALDGVFTGFIGNE